MKIQKQSKIQAAKFVVIFLVVCLLSGVFSLPLGMRMEYSTVQNGACYLYYAGEEQELTEEQYLEKEVQAAEEMQTLQVYVPQNDLATLRVDFENGLGAIELEKITVTFLSLPLITLQGQALGEALVLHNMQMETAEGVFSLISSGADPSFLLIFQTLQRDMKIIGVLMNLFIALILFVLLKNISVPNRKQVFVGVVASVLILPTILYNLLGLAPNAELENRTLAEEPTLSLDTLAEFPRQYEDYYNDHIAFKDEAISFVSATKYYAFHVSTAPRVLLGEDGWLYISETVEDFEQTNLLSDEELAAIVENLQATQAQLNERGIELVVSIAPNKNTVYPHMMPRGYTRGEGESRAEQIAACLEQNNIPFVLLQDALAPYAEETQLYYKGDTHWNAEGAYLGYAALANEMGVEDVPTFEEMTFTETEQLSMLDRDLVNLLNFDLYTGDWQEQGNLFPEVETTLVGQEMMGGVSGVLQYESTAADTRKLLMFRDSFGTEMVPYFTRSFEESAFYWQLYDVAVVDEEQPDVVVIEIAERFAYNLRYSAL